MTILHISYSRMSAYLGCPYRHHLRYVQGVKPNRPQRPLYFGSDLHKLLELRGNKEELMKAKKEIKEKYYEMPGRWQSDLGDNYVQDLFLVFKDYQYIYKSEPLPHQTERAFEIPIGKFKGEQVNFVGVIDELYKYKHKGEKFIHIGEHKTFSKKPDLNTLIMNTQKCLYAKATQFETGILPSKVIWDYIKSTPPQQPVWLEKSGRFSDAKSSNITPRSWRRACKERGITDEEIIRKGDKYKANEREFMFRVEQEFIPDMVDSVWEDFVYTCRQIAKNGKDNKTKNITRDCSFCSYRDICYAELTGGNRAYILEKDFIVEPKEE